MLMPACSFVCRRNAITRYYNLLLVTLALVIFTLHVSISNHFVPVGKNASSAAAAAVSQAAAVAEEEADENVNFSYMLSMVPKAFHKYLQEGNKSAEADGKNNTIMKNPDIEEIERRIGAHNEAQIVWNEADYEPLNNESLVIVVQVHTRLMYLRHLIVSLAQAGGIENALLVFSHDYYDERINDLIRSIDFCKVTQIFYPYSLQTHPNEFPGESPNDCPRDIDIHEAVKRRCGNALYPDLYGHYREAQFTQTKHHWWWKANRVFDGLNITKNYSGPIVFFEEDHYVAPDFIHMLRLMIKTQSSQCPECNILSLGTYKKTINFSLESNKAYFTRWISSVQNMGMAFNRTVWSQIKACASTFCNYDDYNWDWSLQTVSNNCLQNKLAAVMLVAPRVFHIGECGVHHKKSCTSTAAIRNVQQVLKGATKYLFPKELAAARTYVKKKALKRGNGGWGDIRDRQLCLAMARNSSLTFR